MHSATAKKILTCLALALVATNASADTKPDPPTYTKLHNVRVTQINFKSESNYILVHARDPQGNDNVFWIYNKGSQVARCKDSESEETKLKVLELAERYGLPVNVWLEKVEISDVPPGYENQYANSIFVKATEQSFEPFQDTPAPPVSAGSSISGQVVEIAANSYAYNTGVYIQDASGQVYDSILPIEQCNPSSRHLREMAFEALEHAVPVKASIGAAPSYDREFDLLP